MDLRPRHPHLVGRAALLVGTAAALGLAGCSTAPALTLTATPGSVPGDGVSPITVVASVTRGGAAVDGASVHFTASLGAFSGADLGSPGVLDVDASGGAASATLLPPRQGRGALTVTASAAVDGTALAQSAQVSLTPGGGKGADRLDFSCQGLNVGGLVTGRTEAIHVLCTARAYASNVEIKNASIEPYAEAGQLAWEKDDAGNAELVYTIAPGAPGPADVDPLGPDGHPRPLCPAACLSDPTSSACDGEPCWVENSVTHNPRDGLATLMVAVPGTSGSGVFDTDGEPYVDSNDNGVHDSGEPYVDLNGNGKYDPGSGQQASSRLLFRSVRIVWSGDAYLAANAGRPLAASSQIKAQVSGKGVSATLRVHDKNLNKLAAAGAAGTDTFLLAGECTQGATFTGPSLPQALNQDKPGILLAADGTITGPGLSSSYRQGTEYPFSGSVDDNSAHPLCTLSAALSRSYDPGAPGFDPAGSSSAEVVSGGAQF
jgi:hypothetical protein